MMPFMTLFAMVTTEKSTPYTAYALRSFFEHTPFTGADTFLLIDNDGTFSLTEEQQGYPIELYTSDKRRSFAENANLAAARALKDDHDLAFLNNDVIFSAGWFAPVAKAPTAVLVPLSNREIQYSLPENGEMFSLSMRMELDEYLGHEQAFAQIAERHQQDSATSSPYLSVLCAPFFAVFLPRIALRRIGGFDVRFGTGGGEDYDYCIRCHVAGIPVFYMQHSYLLHFGGRSISLEGGAEPAFIGIFREKWGQVLTRLIFDDSPEAMSDMAVPKYNYQKEGFARLIKELSGEKNRLDEPLSY